MSLVSAAENNGLQEVIQLIAEGVNLDQGCGTGIPVLMYAVNHGNMVMLDALLNAVADVNVWDHEGYTALYWASENGHLLMIDRLLAAGAETESFCTNGDNITAHYESSLLVAVKNNKVEAALRLLAAGANFDAGDVHQRTSIMYAVCNNNILLVQMLLNVGVNVNKRETETGDTPLIAAAIRGCFSSVELLLATGANVFATDYEGRTALVALEESILDEAIKGQVRFLLQNAQDQHLLM